MRFLLVILLPLVTRLLNPSAYDSAYMRQVLTARLLQERRIPTQIDSICLAASAHHARYLAATQTLGHVQTQPVPGMRLRKTIAERGVQGEICVTYQSFEGASPVSYEQIAETMTRNWLASPPHRALLVGKVQPKMGVTVVYNPKNYTYYGVASFRY